MDGGLERLLDTGPNHPKTFFLLESSLRKKDEFSCEKRIKEETTKTVQNRVG